MCSRSMCPVVVGMASALNTTTWCPSLPRNADIMLQLGTLVDADTARGVQLVDETADLADVVTVARAKLDALMAVPNEARHNSKLSVRRHNIADFVSSREEELAETMAVIMSAATQNGLDAYMAALKGRKK